MKKVPVSGFSPTPGCLIIVCGLLAATGFLIWAGYTLVTQNREIANFTTDAPEEIVPVNVTIADRNALVARLKAFQAKAQQKQYVTLSLSAEDLNILLTLEPFSEKKVDTVIQVEKIEAGVIHARISFQLRSLPPGTFRYLNGTLLCKPEVLKEGGLVLQTEDIVVPGKTVAEGFLRRYKQDGYLDDMLVKPFRDEEKDADLAALLKSITAAGIEDNTVVITFDPSQKKSAK